MNRISTPHPSDAQAKPNGTRAFIDLRSDTVTLPTPAMFERMQSAPLGDDGLDGDPTAHALESVVARMLGKAAGLYVPTATMGNLLAVLTQVSRQGQVLLESTSHMNLTERGGSTLSGCAYVGLPGVAGEMDLHALRDALEASSPLRTELVCMETTHVNAGGTVLSLEHMRAVRALAHDAGARVHIDGARIFNAATALGVDISEIAATADTVSVCLSKGLSAPAGAVLVGPAETIEQARHLRKMLGGTQRQIGVLAATGLEAVEVMSARLHEDHAMAAHLYTALRAVLPQSIGLTVPASNILFVELPEAVAPGAAWAEALEAQGVLIRPWGSRRIRLVTHRHIDAQGVEKAAQGFKAAVTQLLVA